MSHSFEVQKSEKTFKKLDESTSLHKMMETMLAEKRMIRYGNQRLQHETISLEIGNGITESDIASLLHSPSLKKELSSLLQLIAE